MRKIILRTVALSFYLNIFGNLVTIPRVVVSSIVTIGFGILFTDTSLHYAEPGLETALFWIPFFSVVAMYLAVNWSDRFKIKIQDRVDENISFAQYTSWLYYQVHKLNNYQYVKEWRVHQRSFDNQFKSQDPKFNAWASWIIVVLMLSTIGVLYYILH